ncbi:tRNA (guanine(37)-N(1))-methyltransferase isoform X1 [Petromyzon marinus]
MTSLRALGSRAHHLLTRGSTHVAVHPPSSSSSSSTRPASARTSSSATVGAMTQADNRASCPEGAGHFAPPRAVRGMTSLDRAAFSRRVTVPAIVVPAAAVSRLMRLLSALSLRRPGVRRVVDAGVVDATAGTGKSDADDATASANDAGADDGGAAAVGAGAEENRRGDGEGLKYILLDPARTSVGEEPGPTLREALGACGLPLARPAAYTLELAYDNFRAEEVLRAVLPEGREVPAAFSRLGHIAHVNLRQHQLPYRHLIGQVIIDKNPGVTTVVNKVDIIDSTFRNFHMEVLAGDGNLVTQVRENGRTFELDFAQVYWNPRLGTEHARVVSRLRRADVLLDVFAGAGPFAVPAARRGCRVLANDLNPHAARWLLRNLLINKVPGVDVTAGTGAGGAAAEPEGAIPAPRVYNMDGRAFIRGPVRDLLLQLGRAALAVDGGGGGGGIGGDGVSGDGVSGDGVNVAGVGAGDGAGDGGAGVGGDGVSDGIDGVGVGSASASGVTGDGKSLAIGDVGAPPAIHITMNLPALALDFLSEFPGLLADEGGGGAAAAAALAASHRGPTVHLYAFSRSPDPAADVRARAEAALGGAALPAGGLHHVRNVAPGKEMMRFSFALPAALLAGERAATPAAAAPGHGRREEEEEAAAATALAAPRELAGGARGEEGGRDAVAADGGEERRDGGPPPKRARTVDDGSPGGPGGVTTSA